ncbi:hypothetical protein DES44_1681 [Roseateles depolymerans]|uniref:Uncharacterized protein n=1 Tax=Roseateles depolymerans TaxID=76731 RepID=A0A0U3MF94_9BURK|nr:hypothetical protein RD2015_1738 [Roseateles depolymerans]REG19189.1 hypothetical protein DES44_1681 [Roseateles depolymerans]
MGGAAVTAARECDFVGVWRGLSKKWPVFTRLFIVSTTLSGASASTLRGRWVLGDSEQKPLKKRGLGGSPGSAADV